MFEMRTIKLKTITIILLMCFVLVRSQELILDCSGRTSICVGPLSYKTCKDNGIGQMVTENEFVYMCPPGTRCIDKGDESCASLQVNRDDGIDKNHVTSLQNETLDNEDQNQSSSKTIRDINNHTTMVPSVTEISTINFNNTNDTDLTTESTVTITPTVVTDVKETDGVEANTQQTTDDIVTMAKTTLVPDTTTSNLPTDSNLSLTTDSQPVTIILNPEDVIDESTLLNSNDIIAQTDNTLVNTDTTEPNLFEQTSNFDTTINSLETNNFELTTISSTESLSQDLTTTTQNTELPVENTISLTSNSINPDLDVASSAAPQNNSNLSPSTDKLNNELPIIENKSQLPQDKEVVSNDTASKNVKSNPELTTISLITQSVEQVTDSIVTTTLQSIINPLEEGVNNNKITASPQDVNKSLVEDQNVPTTASYPNVAVLDDNSNTLSSSTGEVSTTVANTLTKNINTSIPYDRPENISNIQTSDNMNEIGSQISKKQNFSNDQNLYELQHTVTPPSEALESLFNNSQTQSVSSNSTNELNLNNVAPLPSELPQMSGTVEQTETTESSNVFQINRYPTGTEDNLRKSNIYVKNTSRISLLTPEGEGYLKTLLKLKIALNELKTNESSIPFVIDSSNITSYKIQNKTVLTFDPINGIIIKKSFKEVYEHPETTTLNPAAFDSSSSTISLVKPEPVVPELTVSVSENSDSVTLRPVSVSKVSDSRTSNSSLRPDSMITDSIVPVASNPEISRPTTTGSGTPIVAERDTAESNPAVLSSEILQPASPGSVKERPMVVVPAASVPVGLESTILNPGESPSVASGPEKSNSPSNSPVILGSATSGSKTINLSKSNPTTSSSSTIEQQKKSLSSSSSSSNNNSSNMSKEDDDSKSEENKKPDDNESDLSKSKLKKLRKKLLKKYKKLKFRCSEEGTYPDSLDCRKYYRCVKKESDTSSESEESKIKLKKHTFKCSDYQVFDPEILKCVYSDNIKCVVHKT